MFIFKACQLNLNEKFTFVTFTIATNQPITERALLLWLFKGDHIPAMETVSLETVTFIRADFPMIIIPSRRPVTSFTQCHQVPCTIPVCLVLTCIRIQFCSLVKQWVEPMESLLNIWMILATFNVSKSISLVVIPWCNITMIVRGPSTTLFSKRYVEVSSIIHPFSKTKWCEILIDPSTTILQINRPICSPWLTRSIVIVFYVLSKLLSCCSYTNYLLKQILLLFLIFFLSLSSFLVRLLFSAYIVVF